VTSQWIKRLFNCGECDKAITILVRHFEGTPIVFLVSVRVQRRGLSEVPSGGLHAIAYIRRLMKMMQEDNICKLNDIRETLE
jgi:hypothetical protein